MNDKNINKYVLRSSVPTKKLEEYNINEHPEYENLVKSMNNDCDKKVNRGINMRGE